VLRLVFQSTAAETGTDLIETLEQRLTSADSGLQLGSGNRVKRCPSEGPAPRPIFSPAEDALKRRVT